MPRAKVNGIGLYYEARGRGYPLVLIMGLGGGHGGWFFQVRSFGRRYRLVTFDNRGVGRTERPLEPYSIGTMADDVVGLMDHLGLDRAHVLGVSMGGMIAQEVAINYPDRVDKLVLASTTPGSRETKDMPSGLLSALGVGAGVAKVDVGSLELERVIDRINSLAFNTRLFRVLILPLARVYMRFVGRDGLGGQLGAALSHDALDRLHLIRARTLVITGTEDRLLGRDPSALMAGRIPDCRLVEIDGGSHTLVAERCCRFNREVLHFLGSA